MVIDTSALLAILLAEKDADRFVRAIENAGASYISAASYLEAAIVIDSRGDAIASREFDRLLVRADIKIEPVTPEQAKLARRAYADFGKGRHSAGLNFGDCLSYALARSLDLPLLFKGKDFNQTDIESALQA